MSPIICINSLISPISEYSMRDNDLLYTSGIWFNVTKEISTKFLCFNINTQVFSIYLLGKQGMLQVDCAFKQSGQSIQC